MPILIFLGPSKSKNIFNRAKLVQKLSAQELREEQRRASDKENFNKNKEKAAVVIQSCKYIKMITLNLFSSFFFNFFRFPWLHNP